MSFQGLYHEFTLRVPKSRLLPRENGLLRRFFLFTFSIFMAAAVDIIGFTDRSKMVHRYIVIDPIRDTIKSIEAATGIEFIEKDA